MPDTDGDDHTAYMKETSESLSHTTMHLDPHKSVRQQKGTRGESKGPRLLGSACCAWPIQDLVDIDQT
jgi:hypothetical protein